MSAIARQLSLPLALLVLVGCGRKKDWDEEIIVQVFRAKGTDVGTVTVTATQGIKTDKATVDGFDDCDKNRVRLIPRQGSSEELILTVTSSATLPPVTCPDGVASCGDGCCKLTPPGSSPLKLVLGTSEELEPKGACTPSSVQHDGGPGKKPLGFPCAVGSECQGGTCLLTADNGQNTLTFTDGYCSADCSVDSCDTFSTCWTSEDALGAVKGKYCVLKCKAGDGICTRSGYECTIGDLCMPQ